MSFFYPLLIFSFSMSQCVIIFLLDLFTMCKIVATLLLFPRCQHYIADDFSDEPDSILCTSLALQSKHILGGGSNSLECFLAGMSTLL